MVKRRGDKTPDPPGGRAAERLRMFEEARGLRPTQEPQPVKDGRKPKKGRPDAKQIRRKD